MSRLRFDGVRDVTRSGVDGHVEDAPSADTVHRGVRATGHAVAQRRPRVPEHRFPARPRSHGAQVTRHAGPVRS